MTLNSRLSRLEEQRPQRDARRPCGPVPWYAPPDHPGPLCGGERITWGEYERRFPSAPKPLRWLPNK